MVNKLSLQRFSREVLETWFHNWNLWEALIESHDHTCQFNQCGSWKRQWKKELGWSWRVLRGTLSASTFWTSWSGGWSATTRRPMRTSGCGSFARTWPASAGARRRDADITFWDTSSQTKTTHFRGSVITGQSITKFAFVYSTAWPKSSLKEYRKLFTGRVQNLKGVGRVCWNISSSWDVVLGTKNLTAGCNDTEMPLCTTLNISNKGQSKFA